MLAEMEHNPAEDLPTLYRAVLDRVGELEASGDRVMARRVRAQAIRIYSRAWDERSRRRLQNLLRRSSSAAAGLQSARASARELSTTV
jgi:hypothetical protein